MIRWPTLIEQSIGVLLLVLIATACMAALVIGLSSNWVRDVLIYSRDAYTKTVARAVREIAKLETELKARYKELDDLEAERKRLTQALADEHKARVIAETRLKDAHDQIEQIKRARTR